MLPYLHTSPGPIADDGSSSRPAMSAAGIYEVPTRAATSADLSPRRGCARQDRFKTGGAPWLASAISPFSRRTCKDW